MRYYKPHIFENTNVFPNFEIFTTSIYIDFCKFSNLIRIETPKICNCTFLGRMTLYVVLTISV